MLKRCALCLALTLAACAPPANRDIILFTGRGTSSGDADAIAGILQDNHFSFATANSAQMNRMSESQLRAYRLLIVPGGNFERIGQELSRQTSANIRAAIRNGLNYLGICAGAFFSANSPYNGLNLTSGVRFGFYSAENRGIHKAAVAITAADGSMLDQYWEDGPELSGWGSVVAKYPDGTPAIVEGRVGAGWMVLSGVHPEAPESWRRGMKFATPAVADHAYAASLVRAALDGASLIRLK